MNKMEKVLRALIEAAEPFTSGDIVDETGGTLPLMRALEEAIEQAKVFLSLEKNNK